MQIVTPHFAVFYNGTEKRPEKEVLKLSDAFINLTDIPEIELTVTGYNINPHNNTQLFAKKQGPERLYDPREPCMGAFRETKDTCIEESYHGGFLEKTGVRENRSEARKMLGI